MCIASPALLYWAISVASVRRAFLRGAGFGLTSFGFGVSWIYHSFQFSNIGPGLAVPLTALFVVFLSLFPALACALFVRAGPSGGAARFDRAATFAGAYLLAEWIRGWLLTGFTWLQLGYAQVDGPFAQALAVFGSYGLGLASALAGCLLVAAWLRSLAIGLGVSLALVLLGVAVAHALPERWTEARSAPLEVAIVQGNIAQDQKWRPEMRGHTLELYRTLTARHPDAALVVWPETAVPGLRDRMKPFLNGVRERALARGNAVLVGLPEHDNGTGETFNSVELLGTGRGIYRKRHLVPFGEYLPLAPLLSPIVDALRIPVSNFTPGPAEQAPLMLGEHRLGVYICYEIAFGGEVAATLNDAGMILTVSNDAWFGDSLGPRQHLQMARARAIETGRYVVRATNTGVSAVVDPSGRLILELPSFEVAHGQATVRMMGGDTPYLRFRDAPAIAIAVVLIVLGGLRARQR